MNKQDIIQKVHALGFPIEDFWLVTGGAMVLYGIKNETHDIDLGCSKRLADRLISKLEGDVEEVRLEDVSFPPVDEAFLKNRDQLIASGEFPEGQRL